MSSFSRILSRLLAAACGIAIVAVSWFALEEFGTGDGRGQIPFDKVEITPPPPYVSRQFREEVRTLGKLPAVLEYPAPDLPIQLIDAFRKHPWVESVHRVDTRSRFHLEVGLIYRVPAAVVVVESKRWLLDRHAVLLPRGLETADFEASLLPIRGIKSALPPEPGQTWQSADVQAAVRLAAAVHSERIVWHLNDIQIGFDPLMPDLRMNTKKGTAIIWETLADIASPNAVSADEKLRRLRDYAAEYGSLDGPAGPYELDVRPAKGLLRRKIADKE